MISSKAQLKAAFLKMLDDHQGTGNVWVAALKHGGRISGGLTEQKRRTLGVSGGNPYLFGNKFQALNNLPRAMVIKAMDDLASSSYSDELLYPGIDLARWMIERECSPAVGTLTPTPTPKPRCKRKVIVVLGDGAPGIAAEDYFANSHDDLAGELLNRVKDAGIELHSLCIGYLCRSYIIRAGRYRYYAVRYNCPPYDPNVSGHCIGYRGGDVMRELAERSGGKFYGVVR